MSSVPAASSGTYRPQPQPRGLDAGAQQAEADRASAGVGSADAAPTAASAALDPSGIGVRIGTLIDGQRATGRITDDQAGALRQALGADGGTEASRGADGASPSPSETLAAFIRQLQSGQGRSPGYGSDGSRGPSLTSSTLLDFNT